jgi:hypothetical protein
MPISKVDKEKRIVTGFATLDNVDRQDDIVPAHVSLKAFNNFRGNIREMHQPIAVGKMISFKEEKYFNKDDGNFYNGILVSAYISRGAQDTWEKVLDGTLTGFSIGGNINDYEDTFDENMDKSIRIIKDYDLNELSLVDSPANQFANLVSVEKGYMNGTKTILENVYWCNTDDIISLSDSSNAACPRCDKAMSNIGFVESNDTEKSTAIKSMVSDARRTLSKRFKTNDYVMLDQNIYGRITGIEKSGSYQMSSSNTILVATYNDPVAFVQLYVKKNDIIVPTDRRIIKFTSSLENVNVIRKSKKEVSNMNNEVVIVDDVINKAQQFEQSSLRSENEPTNPGRQESFVERDTDSTTVTSHTVKDAVTIDEGHRTNAGAASVAIDYESDPENYPRIVKDDAAMVETDDDSCDCEDGIECMCGNKGMNMPMAYGAGMEKPAVQPIMNADGNPTIPRHEMNPSAGVKMPEQQPKGMMNMPMAMADGGPTASYVGGYGPGGTGYSEDLEPTSAERAAINGTKAVAQAVGSLTDLVKALNEKVDALQKQITGVNAEVDQVKNEFGKRVDAVENATAFRKSGDLGEIVQEPEIRVQKSLWDGRFLSTSNIFK